MGHQGNKGSLPQQGRFTAHVWSGKDDDLLVCFVQFHIIADVSLSNGHISFNNRVAAIFHQPFIANMQLRFFILKVDSILCKANKAIHNSQDIAVGLYGGQVVEQLV